MADHDSSTTHEEEIVPSDPKSRIHLKQCIAPFVFGGMFNREEGFPIVADFLFKFDGGRTLDDTCRIAAEIGFDGYDLIGPHSWPILKKYGLIPTMSHLGAAGTPDAGIASKALLDDLEKSTRTALKECAAFGAPNMVAMAGARTDISMEECADNCVAFLNRVKAQAEDLNVTICLENLNSKVDHKGYLFDRTAWGFEIAKRVDSPKVKVLFDIYHAQVQEGDVVRTLRENIQWIGHIHCAGNPGRCQIDENQELNYPFIAREIERLKFPGYVGLEYMPKKGTDAIASLKKGFEIFDTSRW
jgi:hydroxypyruvate isomerase